jgi:hypothetical protein
MADNTDSTNKPASKNRFRAGTPAPTPTPETNGTPVQQMLPGTQAADPVTEANNAIARAANEVVNGTKNFVFPASGVKDQDAEDLPPEKVDPLLCRILSWKRPYNSTGEINFMTWLHQELNQRKLKFQTSVGGNVIVIQARPDKKVSPVLFSCHTDTVHSDCNGDQKLCYDASFGHIFLDKDDPGKGSCLGADDGAGIWLMLELLRCRVPGTYVFHRGEERGGIGSKMLLEKERDFLAKHDVAIAFDRKGTDDIVTHQGGQECASDKCGLAFAERLNKASGGQFRYCISKTGAFTDTKVYREVIDECLNISVGYHNAHGPDEQLDYGHLVKLRDALVKIDFDSLPVDRDARKAKGYTIPQYGGRRPGGGYGFYDMDGTGEIPEDVFPAAGKKPVSIVPPAGHTRAPSVRLDPQPKLLDELNTMDMDELRALVEEDPEVALDVVVSMLTELNAAYTKIETLRGLLGLQ